MSIEAHKALAENKLLKEVRDLEDQLRVERQRVALAIKGKQKAQHQRELLRMQLVATKRELAEKNRIIGALEKENLKLRRSLLEASV